MKNLKYFPFERNKYYYGKLLTEQDFIGEQKYVNDKRRLSNRFLHGVGVAAGLNVVEVDEKSVSVEAGLAYDFSGREIVADTPVICRLSTVDGFDAVMEQNEKSYAYLCLEYDEKEIAPAHNIAGDGGERQDFDRYKEGYRLYLTEREPDYLLTTAEALLKQKKVLYEDGRFRVTQALPVYVRGGAVFETVIRLENMGGSASLSLRLRQELSCALLHGEKFLEAVWNDVVLERGEYVEKTFFAEARQLEAGEATLTLRPEALEIRCEEGVLRSGEEITAAVAIGRQDELLRMRERYYRDAMENAVRESYPQGLYLARIYLIKTGKTYLIDKIENLPFNQYIYSCQLMAGMLELLRDDVKKLKTESENSRNSQGGENATTKGRQPETPRWASGTVEIPLGIGGKKGQRFFSQQLFHGLGLGDVTIAATLEDEGTAISGSSEVFEEFELKAELAVKADLTKGSFVIGMRMVETTSRRSATVRWTACRLPGTEENGGGNRKLYIRPGHLELKVRESAFLETVCEGGEGMTVIWSVKTPEGGTITEDGQYTAPNTSGVYEITARYQEAPELKSSLFAVVRE